MKFIYLTLRKIYQVSKWQNNTRWKPNERENSNQWSKVKTSRVIKESMRKQVNDGEAQKHFR